MKTAMKVIGTVATVVMCFLFHVCACCGVMATMASFGLSREDQELAFDFCNVASLFVVFFPTVRIVLVDIWEVNIGREWLSRL